MNFSFSDLTVSEVIGFIVIAILAPLALWMLAMLL